MLKRLLAGLAVFVLYIGCGGNSSPVSPTVTPPALAPLTCDDTYWQPTYSKDRLQVMSTCETESGIVEFVELEPDGDLTIHIKSVTTRLLFPGNLNLLGVDCSAPGCLQVEIPCQGNITQTDAVGTCKNFAGGTVTEIPKIGDTIEVAAHWVRDSRHYMWGELHGAVIRIIRHAQGTQ